ncbi:MAG: hypothetical protein IPL62_08280 [Caulobacteraceae bacterium]|jgi:hypothetical protein|nr:hypothetical protein [Caulobacteraceae bacterium]MBX3428177.1 hypothetical protein [Hyphomonadaceae bacterium]
MVEAAASAVRTTAIDIISTAKILAVVTAIFGVMFGFSESAQFLLGLMMPM